MIDALLTPAAGAIMGMVGGCINTYMHHKHEFNLAKNSADDEALNSARNTKNGLYWLAVIPSIWMIIGFFFIVPSIIAFLNIPSHVAYEEPHGGIISIFMGNATTIWKTFLSGYVQTPANIFSLDFVLGFMFCRPRH